MSVLWARPSQVGIPKVQRERTTGELPVALPVTPSEDNFAGLEPLRFQHLKLDHM